MNDEYPFGFTFGEKNGVTYKIANGGPDCGPPGNRHCYECYEPVDDIKFNCYLEYDDPMAAVLGKCSICGAPDYQDIGPCPACNGPVYYFGNHYVCYYFINGICDFSVSKGNLEEQEIFSKVEFANLLVGPMRTHIIHGPDEPFTIIYQRIVHTENEGWAVETLDYDPEQRVGKKLTAKMDFTNSCKHKQI
jgi:hypothetical protein